MKNIGIKYRLRFITFIPIFVVTLLFAFFYNFQFVNDLNESVNHMGKAFIRQVIPAAQFALWNKKERVLQSLINASLVNPEIQALAFYDDHGYLLAYHGGKHSIGQAFKPPRYTGDYITIKQINSTLINFTAPITIPRFDLYENTTVASKPTGLKNGDILGWLSIDVNTQSTLIKRYQMMMVTIVITSLGLLLGLIIHYFLSKQIYLPIARLRRSMKQILRNEFETEIVAKSYGEIGIIERGCVYLQQQYLATLNDLSQQIEETTHDLQQSLELLEEKNIELSLDKKKTEEKSRQKSEFIANMSHEIRTPMNGVIGFTDVLLESKLDPLQLDYVKTIKSSAQDLLSIINDILDFSKIDAGKLQLDCIPLDIRACVDEVLTLASPNANKKNIDLIPITHINVPKTVLGDPFRIKQIISNLIANAIKFTDHGHICIRTQVEQETEKGYTLQLTISDTGIGISTEDRNKLFTAFNQADITITRRYGGSGLGLVICKKLCEEMGGKISLVSELNKGSTFTFSIKVEKLAAYESEKHQPHRFSELNILCFDQNPLHLEALGNGLAYWGINYLAVDSFTQIEEALQQHKNFTLVFINFEQDYVKIIEGIIKKYSQFTYVIISKNPNNYFSNLGVQGYLYKPISIQKLEDIIDSLINKKKIGRNSQNELNNLRKQLSMLNPEILLAEDNPVNKMLLSALLNKQAQVTAVDDGEMAVKVCQKKKFHIILLDLHMPNINGLDAARKIRQYSLLNKHSPIILISANIRDLTSIDLKKSGIDFCLQKPIDEKQLISHLLKGINKANLSSIDWDLCVEKVSGSQALAAEFLERFVDELHKNRHEFMQHMHQKNIKGLRDLAHKLHGACCFCGVPFLQKKVIQIEQLTEHVTKVEDLKTVFAELIQSIDAVINEYENRYQRVESIDNY